MKTHGRLHHGSPELGNKTRKHIKNVVVDYTTRERRDELENAVFTFRENARLN